MHKIKLDELKITPWDTFEEAQDKLNKTIQIMFSESYQQKINTKKAYEEYEEYKKKKEARKS